MYLPGCTLLLSCSYLQHLSSFQITKLHTNLISEDSPCQLPGLLSLCTLDAVIGKTHVALNNSLFGNTDEDPDLTLIVEYASELLFVLVDLISLYQKFAG